MHRAMQLLFGPLQKGDVEVSRRSELVLSREQGILYHPGLNVPVLPDMDCLGLWMSVRSLGGLDSVSVGSVCVSELAVPVRVVRAGSSIGISDNF